MAVCNVTLTEAIINEKPLWKSFTFHHFGLFLSLSFGAVAVIISCFLIFQHATHYSRPTEQKHIIRILFMIPVYATVSFLSYFKYQHAIYFEVMRDCYEAFAISSFFALLCAYIEPNLHEQKEFFRTLEPRNWVLPINWFQKCTGGMDKGWLRRPRSGLTWFNVVWISIFQYCFIRVLFTIVSVITQSTGRFCEASLNPAFAHVWVMVFESLSVTIAMYCLIQFYIQLKDDLASHKPFMKVLCIKLVIFFSFWQTLIISFLSSSGVLKTSDTLSYPDIKVGIPSVLLCIEMAIFAVLHVFAFSWRVYDTQHSSDPTKQYEGGIFGIKAYMDAWNPLDIIKASARGFRWLFVGSRRRLTDPSYHRKKFSADNETEYAGVTFAGNGEAATEMTPPKKPRADDRHGLLSDVQTNPNTSPLSTPMRQDNPYAESLNRPAAGARPPQPPSSNSGPYPPEHEEMADVDTGYYGGSHARPAHGGGDGQWDMWSGAKPPSQGPPR